MLNRIIQILKTLRPWHILLVSMVLAVILTEIVVAAMSVLFHGRVTHYYLISGVITAVLVSLIIAYLFVYLIKQLQESITERKRYEEEIRLLQTITLAAGEAEDLRSALGVTLQKVCEATGWVLGEAWVPCTDCKQLEFSAAWYTNETGLGEFKEESKKYKFFSGNGLPGRVWSSKQPAWVRDVTADTNFPRAQLARKAGLKAAMAIPVFSGDEVVAVIDFFVRERREEDERMVSLVTSIASQLGSLIHRKQMEEELRKSEERYRSIFDESRDMVYITKTDGKFVDVNHAGLSLFGYSREEMIGMDVLKIYVNPEERAVFQKEIKEKGYVRDYEIRFRRKDGTEIDCVLSSTLWKDKEGNILGYQGIIRDVTERRKTEEQLRQSQKVDTIGQLAGGIAHDFNNFLTAIIGYANILQMKMKEDDPLRVYLDHILASSEKAASMTQSLLTFSRKQIINPKPVDLNEIIKRVEKLLLRLIREDIELKSIVIDRDLIIMADSGQIEQVLMNLCTNARDAMPKGGHLTIETGLVEMDNEFIRRHGYGEIGKYALLSVTDTGIGMDEGTREKIFEPFFTTKEQGKGTGLGLSMVYGIIKQHNGYINVYSESGSGTTFKMYLPILKAQTETLNQQSDIPEMQLVTGGTETVLLAEDSAEVRGILRNLLEDSGYKVIDAVDGDDAIDKFMENRDAVQLLVLDVVMPKKNGKEVYEEITKLRPDIKALFTSGYTANVIHKKGILDKRINFISKPVQPNQFLRKVREVLDQSLDRYIQ